MRRLINRILVKLGLRTTYLSSLSHEVMERSRDWFLYGDELTGDNVGWKWYGGYARVSGDQIVHGEIKDTDDWIILGE